MFFSNTETSLRHKGNAEWLGKRKISSETSLVGGTFCHHCHKPDKDHEDTECRGAILRQGNEVSREDSEEMGDDGGELGHEGEVS